MRSLKTVAENIRRENRSDDGRPWYPIYNFLTDVREAGSETKQAMIRDEPPGTGDERFDAYLGAVAEHLAFHNNLSKPDWCEGDGRFLNESWAVPDGERHKSMALIESPAAFRRRGIFIMKDDLKVV